MALELIAAIVGAFGMAGIALLLRRLSRGRLPKWIMPVFAGLGLIGVTVVLEYGWFSRVSAELPEGVDVVWQEESASPLRPWTYLAPLVTRFVALDGREVAVHPAVPTLRIARIYSFARWQNTQEGLMVFDCANGRRALLVEGAEVTEAGELTGAEWTVPPAGDRLQEAACREG